MYRQNQFVCSVNRIVAVEAKSTLQGSGDFGPASVLDLVSVARFVLAQLGREGYVHPC